MLMLIVMGVAAAGCVQPLNATGSSGDWRVKFQRIRQVQFQLSLLTILSRIVALISFCHSHNAFAVMSKKKPRPKNPQRPSRPPGWLTSDTDEIERRRLRGANASFLIKAQARGEAFFGAFRVSSDGGQTYAVEIRSLARPINSCECPDHHINGLGTCKHIEATLRRLQHRRKRAFCAAAGRGRPY